jgi:hypothetical protein
MIWSIGPNPNHTTIQAIFLIFLWEQATYYYKIMKQWMQISRIPSGNKWSFGFSNDSFKHVLNNSPKTSNTSDIWTNSRTLGTQLPTMNFQLTEHKLCLYLFKFLHGLIWSPHLSWWDVYNLWGVTDSITNISISWKHWNTFWWKRNMFILNTDSFKKLDWIWQTLSYQVAAH